MNFFTGAGDDGTTKAGNYEMSKASRLAEALGSIDELEAALGMAKVSARNKDILTAENGETVASVLAGLQEDLTALRAEIASGAPANLSDQLEMLETYIDVVAETLPEDSLALVGGDELAAQLLFSRAVARRAERRVVEADHVVDGRLVSGNSLAYLNRLSSLLAVLARRVNFASGFTKKET